MSLVQIKDFGEKKASQTGEGVSTYLAPDKWDDNIFERSRAWIVRGIKNDVMDKINSEIQFQNKNPQIVATMSDAIDLRFSGANVTLTFRTDFDDRYEKMVALKEAIPAGEDKIRVKDLQNSWIGWVLMKVMGIKKNDGIWVAMVRGEGPMAAFFGAVAMHSKNPKFKYAEKYWEEGKEMLARSPKTSKFIPTIDKFAASVAGFAGKYERDPLKTAVGKPARAFRDWADRGVKSGVDGFAEVSDASGRGWKLEDSLNLVSGETLRLRLGQGRKVVFASEVGGVVEVGGGKVERGKELSEGEYLISAAAMSKIPKDTFFDNGVQYKIEKPT